MKPVHADALRKLLGSDGVITDADRLRGHETPQRGDGGRAAGVLRPASTDEVSRALAYCAQQGLPVIAQGGNTGLVGASVPDAAGTQWLLSLERMNRVCSVDAADRTVSVEAGVRLSALNGALEAQGLWLPTDLGADPCIGGMVATNTGGARFLRYGDVRRQVRGLTVVLADAQGRVLRLGRGLRKDNSALDLKQLLIGSNGLLGVITEGVLEVQRRPKQAATGLLVPRDEDAVLELLLALEAEAGEYLSAFEGISQGALDCTLARFPQLGRPFGGDALPDYAVLVELTRTWAPRENETSLQDVLVQITAPLLAGGLLRDARVGDPARLWDLRHRLSAGVRGSGQVVGFDLSLRRADVPRFRKLMRAALAKDFPEFRLCDFGHVADGGLHFNLLAGVPVDAARAAALRGFVTDTVIKDFGGSFSGEHGLGRSNLDLYQRHTPPEQRRLAGAIQALFAEGELGAIRLD